jgi:hypothetical protein
MNERLSDETRRAEADAYGDDDLGSERPPVREAYFDRSNDAQRQEWMTRTLLGDEGIELYDGSAEEQP